MAKKKLKNRIAIVLDRSSSMGPIRAEAVRMFNDQIKEIKTGAKKIKDTTVSLFTFSTVADEPVVFNVPAKQIKAIGPEQYIPNGWTALYDSVGMAVERLSSLPEMADPDCSFLVIIVTDGEENRSSKFTGQRLADHIRLLQATGKWTFTFCGANIDVEKLSSQLHIHKANTQVFAATQSGMRGMSVSNSAGLGNYFTARAAGCSAVMDFYQDPKVPSTPAATTTTTTTTITKPKASNS